MSKLEQVLIIDPPNELLFVGPFTKAVTSFLTLRNPTSQKVCYKIKTTAPKRYCVKPNAGVIGPKQMAQITVSLQPFEYDPNDKAKHKFMVQSLFAPEGEFNQESLWKDPPVNQLMDSKLRCTIVYPDSTEEISGSFGESINDQAKPSATKGLPFKAGGSFDDSNIRKTSEEIKKLHEEASLLRQDNILLREENLRQKRLASLQTHQSGPVAKQDSIKAVTLPDQNALNTAYAAAAVAILIIGILIGKLLKIFI